MRWAVIAWVLVLNHWPSADTIIWAQSANLLPIPDKLVVLSFDDANKSDRAFVAGILKQYGFGATFYVTEGLGFLKNKQHYTTWEEIRELHDMGFEIGNHTQHHRGVARISGEQLKASVRHIEKRCADHGIPKPVTFCYPGFGHTLEAVKALDEVGYLFARRGVRPEYQDGGEGSRGPAYDPRVDHPLLIPSTGYDGPDWNIEDLKWAVDQARDGRIAVLCFHGVPALEHPWVNTDPEDFKKYMQYLKDEGCTVIAMRDLAKYVDPSVRSTDPYEAINRRTEAVDLIHDDFSRFPPGMLSEPIGQMNPAIQEYHYLPHRGVPLEPWANAIGYLDSWAVGDEDGTPYLEQHLSPKNRRMITKLFSPLFVTGDPAWSDYTVEVSVKPLSLEDMAGVVFRYKTNRHHYLFCLQGGNEARLALRLPMESSFRVAGWKELGSAPLQYDATRYYRLKVESRGTTIRAYVDDKLLITARDDGLPTGKAGVSANVPARFQDFHVYTSASTKQQIDKMIHQREDKLKQLRAENPAPKVWKKFQTPRYGCGRNVRFGDLTGDGVPEMLFCQNIRKVDAGNFAEISCLTAVTLEGKILWQIGRPDPRNGLLTSDCPFQVHDVDGDGNNEVVLIKDFKVQILEGRTGKRKMSALMPQVPKDFLDRRFEIKERPHELNVGDSISFFNISGNGRRDILIKDRYRFFWVLDNQLEMLWAGYGLLGHFPYAYFNESSGYDDVMIGYSRWDRSGQQLWTRDNELNDHADGVAFGNVSDNPGAPPMGYYSGSDEGFILIDQHGIIRRHHRIGHAQTACVAKLRHDIPGLQYACINFWKNPGIITIFDYQGNILLQDEPIHSGSCFLPVNWRGDGKEFVLLSGNIVEGGMVDGHLRRVVMFPDDGHPDLCAAVLDLTSDRRDEVILWDQQRVWIYTQDRPFEGESIYAPIRNPHYNDSNYRTMVSRPHWQTVLVKINECENQRCSISN